MDQRWEQEAASRPPVQQLLTHPGVGVLTAQATVLVLGPVERFTEARKVTSYIGLIPREPFEERMRKKETAETPPEGRATHFNWGQMGAWGFTGLPKKAVRFRLSASVLS